MLLNKRSQYSLWLLVYLARRPGQTIAIENIAKAHGLSSTHFVKVSQNLSRHGYIQGFRGKSGGIALAMDSRDIRLGDVVRDSEYTQGTISCNRSDCATRFDCPLKQQIDAAHMAFLAALNQYTLAAIAAQNENLACAY